MSSSPARKAQKTGPPTPQKGYPDVEGIVCGACPAEEGAEFHLPWFDDFHIHLRQGEMMERVTPLVREGGVKRCFVMPNLQPPVTTAKMAAEYKENLERLAPGVWQKIINN